MAVVRRCGKAQRREERSGQGDQRPESRQRLEIGGEEDKESEATIFISSYDVEEDKDIASHQGDQTRHLHGREGAPEGPEQGSGEGAPKGAPQAGAPSEGKAPPRAKSREWKTNRHHCVVF